MKKILKGKLFKNILAPLLRSTTKTLIPPLVPVVELIKNIITPKGEKNPHSWVSIVLQFIMWGLILYAFGTKMITFWDAITLLEG